MHVVQVYKDYPPVAGGIENHLRLLAEGLVRRGHRVSVLVTALGRRTTSRVENGVEVIRAARLAKLASTPLSLSLFSRLRALSPDLVHLHFPYPLGEVAHWITGRRRPMVVTYHSDIVRQRWLGRLYRPLMHRLLAGADRILPTSEPYLHSSPSLKRFRARSTVIPLGIDTGRFTEVDRQAVAAIRRDFPGPLVLFVGRLRYYKGVNVLIAAAERISATLLIVGDGPMRRLWEEQARASPAADRIHFSGDVSDAELPAYYAAADVFVLPSCRRSEAYGLALVEAMAAGTPVISTELGTGTSVVNRHRETGIVVPPGDAAALAGALDELLSDPDLRRSLGRNAGRRAAAELGADRMIERVLAVYDSVLAGRRG